MARTGSYLSSSKALRTMDEILGINIEFLKSKLEYYTLDK